MNIINAIIELMKAIIEPDKNYKTGEGECKGKPLINTSIIQLLNINTLS